MKQLLLAGAALLAIVASHSGAYAEPIVFDFPYTGSLVTFTVPTTDAYQILAFGAQAGGAQAPFFGAGGRGAEIGGDFTLTAGEELTIAVGGAGTNLGGGGGSFVVGPGNTPLVIAGGGGGGGGSPLVGPFTGQGGLTGPDGGGSGGGTGGNGGAAGLLLLGSPQQNQGSSGGGGGFFSAGGTGPNGPTGGGAFPDLTGGSPGGGFGGGGGSGGAGGGGYSGGAGGNSRPDAVGSGGGGGSFDAGTDQILVADFRVGNGEVIITELVSEVPEPSSLALLVVGVTGLGLLRRRQGA